MSPNRANKHERQDRLKKRYSAEERRNHVQRKQSENGRRSERQELCDLSKNLTAKHKQEWSDLSARYQRRKGVIRDQWTSKYRTERRAHNAANKDLWRQYGRDKWRRKREFDKLDSTFYGRLSLSLQAAQMQRTSGDPAFKDVGLAKLTWVNLRNPELRNATIMTLEKQELEHFKNWFDRPLNRRMERLKVARSQDYRDLYATFQDERADLIARQKVERSELRLQWRNAGQRKNRAAQQDNRVSDNGAARSLRTLRAGMKERKVNNYAQGAENKMKSGEPAPPPTYHLEQAIGPSEAAQVNQKTPRQTAKENVVVEGRHAAEKRSLQDHSNTQAKAREALSSMRQERPAKVTRKTPDRER